MTSTGRFEHAHELISHPQYPLFITLRTCTRDKAIGFVCLSSVVVVVVVTKIARSRVLGICSCCNYHKLVDIGEKLVSVRFESLNMAH